MRARSGNCALYHDAAHLTAYVAPDVLLAYGVAVPGKEGYAPRVYGKVPDLVMEMASPSTHAQDSGFKRDRCAALGIAEYRQHAPHHLYLTKDLLGWQLRDGAYVPIPLQPDGLSGYCSCSDGLKMPKVIAGFASSNLFAGQASQSTQGAGHKGSIHSHRHPVQEACTYRPLDRRLCCFGDAVPFH